MSLLADLLSKTSTGHREGTIPPVLERVVREAGKRRALRKRVLVASGLALAVVCFGLGFVSYLERGAGLPGSGGRER